MGREKCAPFLFCGRVVRSLHRKWKNIKFAGRFSLRCGVREKTHGLSRKIQAMSFKIHGTYFKICALYVLP